MPRLTSLPIAAARWSARHPKRTIAAWFAFVALATALAFVIPVKETTDADYRIGESGRAHAMLADAGIDAPPMEHLLITAGQGRLDAAAATAAADEIAQRMSAVAGVQQVAPPVWSGDRTSALVSVVVDKAADPAALLSVTHAVAEAHRDLHIAQSGDLTVDAGIQGRVADDLHAAEFLSIPATLLLMLLAFGAVIAAGVPVLLAIGSVAATLGLSAPLSYLIHAEPTVGSLIVLVGMAVGVDYSLFYLKREREERAKGVATPDAVAIAARTSGHAILVSGAAVMAAMSGLYVVGAATFSSLATGAIVVVAVAVLGSITVLPALLVQLGRWVDRPRLPLLWRLNARIGQGGISRRLIAPVLRHPVVSLVMALALTIPMAVSAAGISLHSANLSTLPPDIPAVATAHRIAEKFPSEGTNALVVVRAKAGQQQVVEARLRELSTRAAATPSFADLGIDPIKVSSDRSVTSVELAIPFSEQDSRTAEAIHLARTTLAPEALDGLGVDYAVGGWAAASLDFADRQSERLPWVIGFVLLLTLVMMVAAFRSVALALISAGLNLLSVGVAFGVLRWIFQDGHFSEQLDFTSPGFLIDWIPIFVMAILVGLSMDYHVFVLSRVREYAASGLPAREAVRQGISDTAGVVTSAAAVMVAVFSIFATLSMLEMKMMGVGLGVAILLDATVIRLVILPATLVLLGERTWRRARHGVDSAVAAQPGACAHPSAPAYATDREAMCAAYASTAAGSATP